MAIQVIVYSTTSGRVKRVADPELNVPSVIQYLNQVHIANGEARLVYNKVGSQGKDTLYAWQSAVSNHTGLVPAPLHPDILAYVTAQALLASVTLTTVSDWCCVIDANNNILQGMPLDPSDGYQPPPNCTIVACPQMADPRWTFTPPNTFTPPVLTTK